MSPFLAYIWFLLLPEIPAVLWTKNMTKPKSFDPHKFNYCNHPCFNPKDPSHPHEHVACNCETVYQVAYFGDMWRDVAMFRSLMLDMHNELRNRIASGAEPGCRDCPKAANMMRLSYDLELEYIAMCHAKRQNTMWSPTHPQNYCRKKALQPFNNGKSMHYEVVPLAKGLISEQEFKQLTIKTVNRWFYECKKYLNISKIIRRFQGGPPAIFRDREDHKDTFTHFTQFVWGTVTHIGCAVGRVNRPYGAAETWYYFECLYGGWRGGPNIMNEPVYIAGEPCTRCPIGSECETTPGLEALCAPISPPQSTTTTTTLLPRIRTQLTDYRESPYIEQFPVMFDANSKKNATISMGDGLITSTALPSNKSTLLSLLLMMILLVYLH